MARKFDCFMLHVNAGTNEKLAILTDSEYRAHISGILAVAATSPVRGRLLVGETEAEPVQIARKAGVTEKAAESALAKLKRIGVLYRDDELNCWAVHDWSDHNPEPKTDATAAERQRRYRARRRAELEEQVYKRDGHRCVACGTSEDLTLDHIVPRSRGGGDSPANLQVLCRPCNSSKCDGDAPSLAVTQRHATSRRDGRNGHAATGDLSHPPEVEGEGEVEGAVAVQPVAELELERNVGTDVAGVPDAMNPDLALSGEEAA